MTKNQMIGFLLIVSGMCFGLEAYGTESMFRNIVDWHAPSSAHRTVFDEVDQALLPHIVTRIGGVVAIAKIAQDEAINRSAEVQLQQLMAMPGSLVQNAIDHHFSKAFELMIKIVGSTPGLFHEAAMMHHKWDKMHEPQDSRDIGL